MDGCHVLILEYEMRKYKESSEVRSFQGFFGKTNWKKFSLICVDAPLEGDMKEISRIDILELNLENSFVILVDDYNRPQEQRIVDELKRKLSKHKIHFFTGVYSGEKDCIIICSPDLSFLCSL